jgi:hypothetical protein
MYTVTLCSKLCFMEKEQSVCSFGIFRNCFGLSLHTDERDLTRTPLFSVERPLAKRLYQNGEA